MPGWGRRTLAPFAVRFWKRVDQSGGQDACWPWTAYRDEDGYGSSVFMVNKKRLFVLAHRYAYQLTYGIYPDRLQVCHTCDNPPCCNPRHLFLGTNADNRQDMINKGRAKFWCVPPERRARGDRNGARTHPGLHKGIKNGRAKLTEDQVRQIKVLLPSTPKRALARQFHVSKTVIQHIAIGKTWAHVA